MPENNLKKIWDVIILQFMIYTITYLPFRVCFLDDYSESFFYYELVMQIFFGIDIVITFFTAFHNENDVLVTSKIEIALNYLRSWFVIDLIACLPLSYVLSDEQDGPSSYNNLIRLGRLSRLYRLLRVIRLIRIVKLANVKKLKILEYFKKLTSFTTSMQRMLKTMILCLMFVHLSSCFFFLIAKIDEFGPDSWVTRIGIQDYDPEIQYLYAFYWSMQTVTTVGFGDITPVSNEEKIFVIIWMAFGSAYYSFVISNLGEELENRENENTLHGKLNALKLFANETKLPIHLLHRLKRYFQFLIINKFSNFYFAFKILFQRVWVPKHFS